MEWGIDIIPSRPDKESRRVLKKLPSAHAALAELEGLASMIFNQNGLGNTLDLQEAKNL